jgi:[ribosomal protein S5]-alanine N-acetyltransferase
MSEQLKADAAIELSTPRCLLRPLGLDDAAQLHELFTSSGVRRFLWDGEIIPFERTVGVIETSMRLFRDLRFGLWGAWSKDTARLQGFAGLFYLREPPELELIYGVGEEAWGKSHATDNARAVVDYAFDRLHMPVVRACTDVPNVASARALEKLGFRFTRRAVVAGLETVFYELACLDRPRGASNARREPVD